MDMKIEQVQTAQGVSEWAATLTNSDVARADFAAGGAKPGDAVGVFTPDGEFRVVLVLPDGTNMTLSTPY